MKAYLVFVTYKDGSKEGVMFTDKGDAEDALAGVETGSCLAVEWSELYEDYRDDLPMEMIEIEI